MKLRAHAVEKPWGREDLPGAFPRAAGRTGEIWFEPGDGSAPPLLVKYIFTSERLSVQVHPDDLEAEARGAASGKSECWYIVAAEPGATLGLGLRGIADAEALRRAAVDGSVVEAMEWIPVRAGDFFYVPAGTVHAIGAGISLVEVQQNRGVTYRLFDYGRPRELHLDDAIAVARLEPYDSGLARMGNEAGILIDGPHFTVAHVRLGEMCPESLGGRDRWIVPLAGNVGAAGTGDCLFLAAGETLQSSPDADYLVAAAPGDQCPSDSAQAAAAP
jgi:mannose-6-phosphate isomerase